MKKFCLFLLFISVAYSSFSAPLIKAIISGNWNNSATWDLGRLPQTGDTIIIPTGKIILVNDDRILEGFVYIGLYGKLSFQNNNSTLNLSSNAVFYIFSGGQVMGGGSASQKIRLNGITIFQGNQSSLDGPLMASMATTGFQAYAESVLPVKFIGFTVSRKNNDVMVQWSTSEEQNALAYEVEYSVNGRIWNRLASIAAAGNSNTVNHYSYTDYNRTVETIYYRIRQIDQDGRFSFTPVQAIRKTGSRAVEVSISAVQHKVLLQFSEQVKGNLTVRFVSGNGQVADQQVLSNASGQVVLTAKVSGNYIISLSNGQGLNMARQVIL